MILVHIARLFLVLVFVATASGWASAAAPAAAPPTLTSAEVAAQATGLQRLSASASHTVIITDTDRPYGLGNNGWGELTGSGGGQRTTTSLLVGLPEHVTARQVTGGSYYTVVLGSDGQAYGTGNNSDGQLTGPAGTTNKVFELTPLSGLPAGVQATDVSAHGSTTVLVGSDGNVYGTGDNAYGQLTGQDPNDVRTLRPLTGLPEGVRANDVEAGTGFTIVLADDQRVYAAGSNAPGGARSRVLAPVTGLPVGVTMVAAAGAYAHSLLLGDDGVVYGAGSNGHGQLTGGSSSHMSFRPLSGLPEGVRAVAVSAGQFHSVVLGSDGVVYGTGNDLYGQITGDGFRNTLQPLTGLPTGVAAVEVDTGDYHTLVRGSDGRIYATGRNTSGQIGAEGTSKRSTLGALTVTQDFISTVRPTVSGAARVGETVRLMPGEWLPSPEQLSVQWFAGGEALVGATQRDLQIPASAEGVRLHAVVTASATGYRGLAVATDETVPVARGRGTPGEPTVTGVARVGEVLSVDVGGWTPPPTGFRFSWTTPTDYLGEYSTADFRIPPEAVHEVLTVEVIGARAGYEYPTVLSSLDVPVVAGTLSSGVPVVRGRTSVGSRLTVATPGWDPRAEVSYAWLAGGVRVATTRSPAWVLPAKTLGRRISVEVTGTRQGYTTVVRESPQSARVSRGVIGVRRVPRLLGDAAVGALLRVREPALTVAPVVAKKLWLRDGRVIRGAQGDAYRVRRADRGRLVAVRFVVRAAGYRKLVLTTPSRRIAAR